MNRRSVSSNGRRKKYRVVSPWRFYLTSLVIFILITSVISFAAYKKSHDQNLYQTMATKEPALGGSDQKSPKPYNIKNLIPQDSVPAGTKIDEYKGVAVYSNGTVYTQSHGLNFSEDGYYYGYEWQCVEFVKRFYYDIYDHKMPDGAGHAKYFFNPMLAQGEFNEQRGLYQFINGGDVKPKADDLLVFNDSTYGHVAIISQVGPDWVEVIQQNMEYSRQRFTLVKKNSGYYISGDRVPAGWLRIKS